MQTREETLNFFMTCKKASDELDFRYIPEPQLGFAKEENILLLLEFLDQHPEITKLNLSMCKVDTDGAKALAKNTTLISLDLSMNRINDSVVDVLIQNKTLISLNLDNSGISIDNHKKIDEMLKRNQALQSIRQKTKDSDAIEAMIVIVQGFAPKQENSFLKLLPSDIFKIIFQYAFNEFRSADFVLKTYQLLINNLINARPMNDGKIKWDTTFNGITIFKPWPGVTTTFLESKEKHEKLKKRNLNR